MKKLLQKTGLFFLALILIKMPFAFFYEDELIKRKSEFAKQDFDKVFIGSSRTKSSVIPPYFDSLTKGKSKSYNFAVGAGVPPRTFDWCEEMIQNKPSLKYIFFELSGGIDQYPFYEEPWKSFSFREHLRTLRMIPFEIFGVYHDNLTVAFFKPNISKKYNDYNVPLQDAFEEREVFAKKVINPKQMELSHSLNLQVEKNEVASSYLLNQYYWDSITRIIELAEAKQIRIYFFIPPRILNEKEFKTIPPIYQKLDKKYKLDAAHYEDSLYKEDTSSDNAHLNTRGARRFTELMAEAFNNHNF